MKTVMELGLKPPEVAVADLGTSGCDPRPAKIEWARNMIFRLGSSAACLPLILIFLSPACREPEAGSKLTRIIDDLGAGNFVESPLLGLATRFPRTEASIKPEDLTLVAGSGPASPAVLVYPLDRPALQGGDPNLPPLVTVREGSEELAYAPSPELKGEWAYLPSRRWAVANRVLFRGDRWSREIVLPAGPASFTAVAFNPQPQDYNPHLRFALDGEIIGEVVVATQTRLTVASEVKPGRHTLELGFDEGANLNGVDERGACLRLARLEIECASDLLLLAAAAGTDSSPGRRIDVSYAPDPRYPVPDEAIEENLADFASLYEIATDESLAIPDSGVGDASSPFKRKLHWRGSALNVVLAPPSTEFKYQITPAEESILEFGCGIINNAEAGAGGVRFRVSALTGSLVGEEPECVELFDKTVAPGDDLLEARVDLADFGGRTVELAFITEPLHPGGPAGKSRLSQAFWSNPIVFGGAGREDDPPNVILISLDTLRADHVGCYGYPRATTPNLDGLAAEGVLFERAYSTTSWTLPAHVSLLTGLTSLHHDVLHENYRFDPSLSTLADLLRQRGYLAGAITGGGLVSSGYGFAKGFDSYVDEGMSTEETRAPDILFRKASDWLGRNADKTFFLFLHAYQPHDPYVSPPPFGQAFLTETDALREVHLLAYLGRRGYYRPVPDAVRENIVSLYDGDIRCVDEVFLGPLFRLLKDRGLYDRTMIIVTSDHGEEFYEHGGWQHGQTLYDEVIKVPLVVKLPDSRLKGSRVRPAARTIDILPTVLEELNVRHSRRAFDGRSLFPLIEGRERRAREIPADVYGLVEFPSPLKNANPLLKKFALVAGTNKLVFGVNHNKYRFFFSPPPRLPETIEIELYDLARDPKELNNLAAREPGLVRSMMARIEKYVGEGRRSARGRDASLDARRLDELRALGYIR